MRVLEAVRMRLLLSSIATSVIALVTACATPVPTADMRAKYGDVAIELQAREFALDLTPPVTSRTKAVSIGVGRGLLAIPAGMIAGLAACSPAGVAAIVCAAIGGAAGLVYAPISILTSFAPLAPAERVEEAEPLLRAVLSDPSLADRLVARVRERAATRHGIRRVDFDSSTTAVIVRLVSVTCDSPTTLLSFDEPVQITTTVAVRIVRRADDEVLWSAARAHKSTAHRFLEWADDDAALARTTTDAAVERLGDNIARAVFAGVWELVEDPSTAGHDGRSKPLARPP